MKKAIYIAPKIDVQEVIIEESIANASAIIRPGDETGNVAVDTWTDGGDFDAPEEGSRW